MDACARDQLRMLGAGAAGYALLELTPVHRIANMTHCELSKGTLIVSGSRSPVITSLPCLTERPGLFRKYQLRSKVPICSSLSGPFIGISAPFSLGSGRHRLSIYWYLARIRLIGSGAKLLGRVAESRRLSKIFKSIFYFIPG